MLLLNAANESSALIVAPCVAQCQIRGELTAADLTSAFQVRITALRIPSPGFISPVLSYFYCRMQIFDSNGDGFISSDELDYMLHLLSNKRLTGAEIRGIIQAADQNGDGKIDFHEFCAIMQARF